EPLTPLSPPSSHLKGVVIPSAIVFYLTEMYKYLHILLSGRPCSEHQAERGVSTPKINSRNLTSTLRSLLQLKRAYSDSVTIDFCRCPTLIGIVCLLLHVHSVYQNQSVKVNLYHLCLLVERLSPTNLLTLQCQDKMPYLMLGRIG